MNKLTAHLMKVLSDQESKPKPALDGSFYNIVSKRDGLLKADSDFDLGMGLGFALREKAPVLIDFLEYKFLANTSEGKLYEVSIETDAANAEWLKTELDIKD